MLKLNLEGEVINKAIIQLPNCDLRDPKLSIDHQDRLSLLAYCKHFDKKGHFINSHPMHFFSTTGFSWSSGKRIGDPNWWLWRLRWHQPVSTLNINVTPQAYGFAYNRQQQSLNLYSGQPGGTFTLLQPQVLGLTSHQLGYPNESDIVFQGNTAWAIVRRDADTCTAQLGCAKYPFKHWQWRDLGIYLGGPCMIQKNASEMWLSGRVWENQRFFTRIYLLTPETLRLTAIGDLPSGGDNSYPGMVQHNNHLYVSYYSSHIDQKSQIYLAILDLEKPQPMAC